MSGCLATSAKFPLAQAESGRQWNIKIQVIPTQSTNRWVNLYNHTNFCLVTKPSSLPMMACLLSGHTDSTLSSLEVMRMRFL